MQCNETNKSIPWIGLLSIVVMFFGLSMGCVYSSYDRGGPPPWAPAHGYRAKHQYLYYPSVSVYFDIDRKVYFYQDRGKWKGGNSRPNSLYLRKDEAVHLDMDTDKPYKFHKDVTKRYPPKKWEKEKDHKHNEWSK